MNPPATLQLLLSRAREALGAAIDFKKPHSAAAAPAILDVMGGIAEFTGSATSKLPLNRYAAALTQRRDDGQVQVFSFDCYDEHRPFTLRMPVDRLRQIALDDLERDLRDPNRRFAGGALAAVRLEESLGGVNVVMLNGIAPRAGIASSIAAQVAITQAISELVAPGSRTPDQTSQLAWAALDIILGVDASQSACAAAAGGPALDLPAGFELAAIVGIPRDPGAAERIHRHRSHATAAHSAILVRMREMGRAAGRELIDDPLGGQLARLDPDDYKKFFRMFLSDPMMLGAADHHVLEARRVGQFQQFMAEARALDASDIRRHTLMDKAGHLMYASHLSMMNDARLGDDRCDWLVQQVRASEKSGLYGARMTGFGCGGAVAVLHEAAQRPREVVQQIAERAGRQFGIAMNVLTPPA